MWLPITLATIISIALAAPCVHNNQNDLTAEYIIRVILTGCDRNLNGILSGVEIIGYFLDILDQNGNAVIEKEEFTRRWFATFHDEEEFALHLFQHLDMDSNDQLDLLDVEPLLIRVDTSGDGFVQEDEFKEYLQAVYRAC